MAIEKKKKATLIFDFDLGHTTRNTHVKYERYITHHSKVMANVKEFCRQTNKQTNGQTVKWTNRQGKNYVPPIYAGA